MDDERLTSDPEFAAARRRIRTGSQASGRIGASAAGFSAALNSFLDILAEVVLEDSLRQNGELEEQ